MKKSFFLIALVVGAFSIQPVLAERSGVFQVTLPCGLVTLPDAVSQTKDVRTFNGATNGFSNRASTIAAIPFEQGGYRIFMADQNCVLRSWRGNGNLSNSMTALPGTDGQTIASWQGWEFNVNSIVEIDGEVFMYGFAEMNNTNGAFTLPYAPSLNVTNGTIIPLFWTISANIWGQPVISAAQLINPSTINDGGLTIVNGNNSNISTITNVYKNNLGWVLACDDRSCEVIKTAPIALGSCSNVNMPSDFAYPIDLAAFQTSRFTVRRGLIAGYKKDGTAGFWIVDNNCNANGIGINPLTIDAPIEVLGAPRSNNWVYELTGFGPVNRGAVTTTVALYGNVVNYDGFDLGTAPFGCPDVSIVPGTSFDVEYNFSFVSFTNTALAIVPTTFCDFNRCGDVLGLGSPYIIACNAGPRAKPEMHAGIVWDNVEVLESLVNVFPNPALNTIQLEYASSESKVIQLIDMTGRIVMIAEVYSGQLVEVGQFPRGVYTLTIGNKAGHTTFERVVLQ